MVRDLMEIGVNLVRKEELDRVAAKAEKAAEERLLDLLYPETPRPVSGAIEMPASLEPPVRPAAEERLSTREKLRKLWREGKLDERMVPVEVSVPSPQVEIMSMPGMEDMGLQFKDMFSKMFPQRKKTRTMRVRDAYEVLLQEESERLVDMDKVAESAKERVEQTGIIFIDEIDKICGKQGGGSGPDVSREGVQRDLLPVVEGCVVNTKYGMVKTDHILFIAAGAFHFSKPSDLVPELQGRFPLRVELLPLTAEDFYRILTEPKNALTVQYKALLGTEGVALTFTDEALRAVADFACRVNAETENIGARRLYTIMEKILSDLSFAASDQSGQAVTVDPAYVREHLADVAEDRDLSRYIL
jgi:ATP-dependent HslUV protease ATP-binding subunit HslU